MDSKVRRDSLQESLVLWLMRPQIRQLNHVRWLGVAMYGR